ncbi:MAG: phosphoribosylanthranilate isomerase [bacterium]|jgi:phosphoribosylanthranilate isomerase
MRIKVCGMTNIVQLKELEEMGVDFAGFIFYARSPRFATRGGLTPQLLKQEKLRINRVGVFVNESEEMILRTVETWKLDVVQLHGDESPIFCEKISNHINTIKAFRVSADDNIAYKVSPYVEATDLFLFDTMGKQYGGTGEQFNWDLLKNSSLSKPYLLSGGIGHDDVDKINDFCKAEPKLFALDINSKFETAPGVKDMTLLKRFVTTIKKNG